LLLDLTLLAALGLALRLPTAVNPSTDNWSVLAKIANQRGRRWLTYAYPDSLIPGIHAYPILIHYFVAKLPRRFWFGAGLALVLISDVLMSFALYAFLRYWLPEIRPLPSGEVRWLAFLASAAFVSTPLLVPVTARMRAANARAPSLLLVTGYLLALGAATLRGEGSWLLPCVSFGLLSILASSFATQVLIGFSLVIALAAWSPWPLLALAATLAIAWYIPVLGARAVLFFKVNHSLWYLRNRAKVTMVANRNLLRNALRTPVLLFRDPVQGRRLLFREAPLWIVAYSLPLLWLVLAQLADGEWRALASDNPVLLFSLWCTLAAAVCFFLTSSGPLTVFGQAERYFEYAIPMLTVLAAAYVTQYGLSPDRIFVPLLIANIAIIGLVQVFSENVNVRMLTRGCESERAEKDVARFLAGLPAPVRVATLPIKLAQLFSYYTRGAAPGQLAYYYRFVVDPTRKIDRAMYFDRDTSELDVFSGAPEGIKEQYAMGWIVADKSFLKNRRGNSSFIQALEKYPIVYENERYVVYQLGSGSNPS